MDHRRIEQRPQVVVFHRLASDPCSLVRTQASRAPISTATCAATLRPRRSEEHTSELQSHSDLVCRLLLEKKKKELDLRCEYLTSRIDQRSHDCRVAVTHS